MARSAVRAKTRRKGKKVPARDEIASTLQLNKFFEALTNSVVFNVGDAARKAGIPLKGIAQLRADDADFGRRLEEARVIHREALKKQLGDRGFGADGRSADIQALKLYQQIEFPELSQDTKSIQVNVQITDIKGMTTEELLALKAKLAKSS